jgi:hypothetical protein
MRGAPREAHPKGNDFLAYALWYAKLGFRVIPLKERSKEPLIADWPNKATTDEATIRGWWAKWPKANIGLATGRYGDGYFCVLDFDPRNGGDWYGEAGPETLPPTWVVHTGGGGRHYYYRTRELLRGAKLEAGVDLKGEGGYVVAPPSIHPEGGPYVWEVGAAPGDMPIGEVPEWVLREAAGEGAPENGGGGRRPALWRMPPPIPKGMRHDYLVSLAGALWGAGVRESEVEAVLWGVLELFETREDFDPVAEIGGILKGLKGWEGEGLDLAIVLRSLPKAVRAIVMREVTGAAVSATPKANSEGVADGKGAGEKGESKEKKGRKAKPPSPEDIKAILLRYKWVKWQGALWQVSKPKLLRVDLDRIHGVLKQNGLDVGKETLKSYIADIMADIPKPPLEGLVVSPEPTYGVVGGVRGLWFRDGDSLYVVTPNEVRRYAEGQWPEGVYALDLGESGVLPDWAGEVEHLLAYWGGSTTRLSCDPRVALAMFLPVLFGQGHIGIILRGAARSGKSTLLKAMAYLRLGRKPNTPSGGANMRDLMAVLHREQIVFFDEVNTFSPELQETLKRMITGDGTIMRALYTDLGKVETELKGSAVFCTTNLEKLASDLRTRCFVWDLEEKGGSLLEAEILAFCGKLWRKALGGAIKLYQLAAKLKPPPNSLLPQVRFRDWLSWAYRYAIVLGVEKEFVAFVAKSKRAAHRGDRYDFLLDAITHPDFDPSKEYTISDLIVLGAPSPDEAKRVQHALNSEGVRADLIALALDAGYNLRIEKRWDTKKGRDRYKFIFSPLQTGASNYLRELLQSVGIEPDWEGDWDGEAAPPSENGHAPTPEVHAPSPAPQIAPPVPEPLSQNGHAPTPEVHTPPPAPEKAPIPLPVSLSEVKKAVQKAAPPPEPVRGAAEGAPAGVGDGVPMAPPEKPMAIAVQSAQSPEPFPLTPEEKESHERAIAGLREELARLPKPGGLLQQRGTPIAGWGWALAPPELTEYLRALAFFCATEASRTSVIREMQSLWWAAGKYLWDLTAFEPTREAIAGMFLARASYLSLEAATDPNMREAAVWLAGAAHNVFFRVRPPEVLLEILLATPPPSEYDPCKVPHYRMAVCYMIAAHWVLTGRPPEALTDWVFGWRCEPQDAEALLLLSLGRQKMGQACAHLYLGDLPF